MKIKIYTKRRGDNLEIYVEDNGLGCDTDELNEFLKQNGDNSNVKMGIKNVNKRIKLKYGKESGLRYEKNPEGGTLAIITISLKNNSNGRNTVETS